MKVKGLDNKTYILSLSTNTFAENKSALHKKAKSLIKELWSSHRVYEEVFLPGCKTNLFIDFFIPMLRLGIEVQGQQHTEYNSFFHKNKSNYISSVKRDKNKKEWCELNNITLIELPFDEDEEQWKTRLINHQTN